jgi:hypothetical protein
MPSRKVEVLRESHYTLLSIPATLAASPLLLFSDLVFGSCSVVSSFFHPTFSPITLALLVLHFSPLWEEHSTKYRHGIPGGAFGPNPASNWLIFLAKMRTPMGLMVQEHFCKLIPRALIREC